MKKYFHFHFYIRIFILIILGVVFSVLITKANTGGGGLDVTKFEFNGWAWSPNIGWVSLNCQNDFDGDGTLEDSCLSGGGIDYGLYLDTSNDETVQAVGGCAWAGNVGWWICFDDPDDDPIEQDGAAGVDAPDYGVYVNDFYFVDPSGESPDQTLVVNSLYHGGDVSGHASIVPLEDAAGWSNELGFPISTSISPGTMEGCFNCSEVKQCSHDSSVCVDNADCGEGNTCDTIKSCDNCLEYDYDGTGALNGVIGGYDCTSCAFNGPDGIDTICPLNSYNNNQNTCNACTNYYTTPGLIVDHTTSTNDGYASMCGWSWNQDSVTSNGVGWLQFSPRITSSNNPYFSVDKGNVYSRGNIRSQYALPPNTYNAYIIEAGGDIYQLFASSTVDGLSTLPNRPLIDFPTYNSDTGHYSNILGKIDYTGLIIPNGEELLGIYQNKYGSVVKENFTPGFWTGTPTPINGEVFLWTSDISGPPFGDVEVVGSVDNKGSGMIIVEGDLDVNHNITYADTDIDQLYELASLVWIVKGDVTISPTVTELAGTFIVLGDGVGDCSLESPDAGCGQFITGISGNQLTVYGLVLAKKFELGRTYTTGGEPAEKFINDGRLQINPPAGLEGFAQSSPKFNYNPQ